MQEELTQQIETLTKKLEDQQKHIETYHKEVETLMRQVQRNAQTVIILSDRLRAHGLDYKVVPDEKEVLG